MTDTTVYELEHVWFEDRGVVLLEDLTLQIGQGTIVSLVGPNGAGKSTLVRLLIGLYEPTRGCIHRHQGPVGYVPQFLQLDSSIPVTVSEFLSVYGRRGATREDFVAALEEVGAVHLLEKSVPRLSGGERRRMLIASALLQQSTVLLLDEPVAGMDTAGEKEFHQLMKQLKEQGYTIVLVSHDVHHVAAISDQVVCLDRTIQCQGTLEEVSHCDAFGGTHVAHFHHHHE